jgi:hypothetical protein
MQWMPIVPCRGVPYEQHPWFGESQENKYLRAILDNPSGAARAAGGILGLSPAALQPLNTVFVGVHAPAFLIMIRRCGRVVNFVTTKNSAPGSHRRHLASVRLG